MDEPTSGLDPLIQAVFRDCIREAKAAGKTVFLSSHVLSEVQDVCDHISIVRAGSLVEAGALSELRRLTLASVSVETERPIQGLGALAGVEQLTVEGETTRFRIAQANLGEVMQHLVPFGVLAFNCEPASLEEMFMDLYRQTSPEPAGGR